MAQFLKCDSSLPPYMAFPNFLLSMTELSETAKIVYVVLLNRSRLSMREAKWQDEEGQVFIYYPIKDLAKTMHKSEMTIKTALRALEDADLIWRKHNGVKKANQIFVKVPPEFLMIVEGTENCLQDGQKTVSITDRKLSTSNKEKRNKEGAINKCGKPRNYECGEDESL